MKAERLVYEAAVRAIADWATDAIASGEPIEQVAREAVARRNALKRRFREGVDPDILRLLELRNLRKYGDPIGPQADALLDRYGSWTAVIAAACRHARLDG